MIKWIWFKNGQHCAVERLWMANIIAVESQTGILNRLLFLPQNEKWMTHHQEAVCVPNQAPSAVSLSEKNARLLPLRACRMRARRVWLFKKKSEIKKKEPRRRDWGMLIRHNPGGGGGIISCLVLGINAVKLTCRRPPGKFRKEKKFRARWFWFGFWTFYLQKFLPRR